MKLVVFYRICLEAFMVTTVKSYWTVIHVGFVSNIFETISITVGYSGRLVVAEHHINFNNTIVFARVTC